MEGRGREWLSLVEMNSVGFNPFARGLCRTNLGDHFFANSSVSTALAARIDAVTTQILLVKATHYSARNIDRNCRLIRSKSGSSR